MNNLNELLASQNQRILTLQMLVEALVDELIETKKIKESKLDDRFVSKMEWMQEQLDNAKQEVSMDYLKTQMFGGKIGEA